MFSLRATRKLLTLMKTTPMKDPPAPTTILGDWYANVTGYGPILCVSEKTLLPVLLPREAIRAIPSELSRALSMVLDGLGVDKADIERERFAMMQSSVSTTADRRIVGFLNQFAFLAEEANDRPLIETSLWIAETPCNAASRNCTRPDKATREAFTRRSFE